MEIWAKRIYQKEGFCNKDILNGKKALDVGCGQRKLPGAVGFDVLEDSQADVLHDINKFPWPFNENEFDLVLLNHVLEHVESVQDVMEEIHRVGKPGAHVVLTVPYFRHVDAFTDPTHKRFLTSHSLDFFIKDSLHEWKKYSNVKFEKIGFWFGFPFSKSILDSIIIRCRNHFPDFYENYISKLSAVKRITWEIKVMK